MKKFYYWGKNKGQVSVMILDKDCKIETIMSYLSLTQLNLFWVSRDHKLKFC